MKYLTVDDVVDIHDLILEELGAPESPLLHRDKLDSAINRPRQLVHHDDRADLVAQAVVLAEGVSHAQAFLDGNKRAARGSAALFLLLNGVQFSGNPIAFSCWLICIAGRIGLDDQDACVEHFGLELAAELDVASTEVALHQFEAWLRQNVIPVDDSAPD